MNSENDKTSLTSLTFKLWQDLVRSKKRWKEYLSNFSIYYIWKSAWGLNNNNKFKISAPTSNDKLEVLEGLHSVSDIQDYFEYRSKNQ